MTIGIIPHKGKPVQQQPNQEDQQKTFGHFFPEYRWPAFNQSRHYKSHGIAHRKEEEWKYQVGGGYTMPFGMFEWSVDISPAAGGIYQDHQGHGGAAEDIEGVKSLIIHI